MFKSSTLGEIRASKRAEDLRSDHKSLGAYLAAARAALSHGDCAKALGVYKEALRHYGEDPVFLNDFAWFLLTEKRLGKKERDLSLALRLARKAVALDGGMDPNSLDTLALALFMNGKTQEAAALQEKAVSLRPGDSGMRKRLKRFRKALSAAR